jgi:ABC-2 type transport system ATP-binding protein
MMPPSSVSARLGDTRVMSSGCPTAAWDTILGMSDALLAVAGLTKRYGDFTAVTDLTLQVAPRTIVALLGPNGAGKTTAIRMLIGQLRPSAGTASVGGLDCFAQRDEVMRITGYLPDEPVFHDYLTGRELLRFVGGLHGLDKQEIRQRAEPLLARLELGSAIDDYAVNYSRGMKKKLALAMALLHRPRLLILDEPANGLDPYAARELLALVREQASNGASVVFSTHLLDQAERISDRAVILAKGRLVADGTVAELRQRAATNGSLEEIFFALTTPDPGGVASASAGEP